MVFGLGKKKKDEMEQIKEAVAPEAPEMPMPLGVPELDKVDIPSVSEPKQFAPLFIKIDRYKEVLQKVQKMRALINNINALLRLQDEVEKLEGDASEMLKKNVEEFSMITSQLDKELLRPQQMEPYIRETNVRGVEGYSKNLEEEINKLKGQLRNV